MAAVHKHKEGFIKPGNEDYLSYYNQQKEWEPTQSTGTLGSMSSSPGPAIVLLPSTIGEKDHDPRKTAAPAFKIGIKDDRQTFSCSPGPAKYDTRKITNKGLDKGLTPVIGEKLKGLVAFSSPGPAKYDRGIGDKCIYTKLPAYTMRPKVTTLKGFIPPAPDSYVLPETLGPGRSPFKKSPCYSMGERLDKTGVYQPNPGPAAYNLPPTDINKLKAPAFTMRAKEKSPLLSKTGISSPGPASNLYHMVKFHKPSTPRFSFGIRHTPFKAFQHFDAEK